MSARISGVKNLVAYGVSLVLALPFSQVKSPKAKGVEWGSRGSAEGGTSASGGTTGGAGEVLLLLTAGTAAGLSAADCLMASNCLCNSWMRRARSSTVGVGSLVC